MADRAVLWFRRDLRTGDHPALAAAATAGRDGVLALFVADPRLWDRVGERRRARLAASLAALDRQLDGRLLIAAGDPCIVVPAVAAQIDATAVHVTTDTAPFGRRRDEAVAAALATDGRSLVATGSPYAVTPGRLRTGAGGPYRVFTPFHRAWLGHGWPSPAHSGPDAAAWLDPRRLPVTGRGIDGSARYTLPNRRFGDGDSDVGGGEVGGEVGEAAAQAAWRRFLADSLAGYTAGRDRPDLSATSQLSAALHFGEIHPRTLLADLSAAAVADETAADAVAAFRRQLAWREFYADVLWHHPHSSQHSLNPTLDPLHRPADEPDARAALAAWQSGRTGYPFVDAGMRQLAATGWMHNRTRMVTASFLVKDLHLPWWVGADWFAQQLLDADVANNAHGWQWVAGTGTDAAPYFRVFNPVLQGRRFDPYGDYVRQWVPELRGLAGASVHEPWAAPDGPPRDYPDRIVDHSVERAACLDGYSALTAAAAIRT